MIRSGSPAFRHDRSAMAAVEFALIVAPFLALVFGTLEFGRVLWMRAGVQIIAIEGARCMGVKQTACASSGVFSQTATKSHLVSAASAWGIPLTNSNITLPAGGVASSGVCNGLSEVSISYTFQTVVPGLLPMLSGGTALTGHACFPVSP